MRLKLSAKPNPTPLPAVSPPIGVSPYQRSGVLCQFNVTKKLQNISLLFFYVCVRLL